MEAPLKVVCDLKKIVLIYFDGDVNIDKFKKNKVLK